LDVDLELAREALDVDLGDAGVRQPTLELLAQLEVLVQELLVVLLREPARVPGPVEAEPEAVGMNFLTHAYTSSESSMVRWLLRWSTRSARPIGAGRTRRSCGPLSTVIRRTTSWSTSRCASFCSALATAERSVFRIARAATLFVLFRTATASLTFLPR